MRIEVLYFGDYKLAYISVEDSKFITCTSIINYWLRAYRKDRLHLHKQLDLYKFNAYGVDVITLSDFRVLLNNLLDLSDSRAKSLTVSFLDKCWRLK